MPIFDAAAIRFAVAEQLAAADLPNDARTAAVILVTRDSRGQIGVTGALAAKVGEHWELRAAGLIDHEAHIEGGFEIKASW